MENEKNDDVIIEDDDITDLEDPQKPEDGGDIDWKAEAEKYKGIASRRGTKLKKFKESAKKKAEEKPASPKEAKPKPEKESTELGYGEKAFLKASGIEGQEAFDLIQDTMKNSGKSLEEVIELSYIKHELKSLKEKRDIEDATPSSSKRGKPGTGKASVDYWVKNGGLPEDKTLALKVIQARRGASGKKALLG